MATTTRLPRFPRLPVSRRVGTVALLLGLLAGGLPAAPVAAGPPATAWPTFQYDSRHSGRSPVVGAQTAALKWTALPKTATPPFALDAPPVVGADGTVYVHGSELVCVDITCLSVGRVYALAPDTGVTKWAYPPPATSLPFDGVTSALALGPDGTVYVGFDGAVDRVVGLDLAGGERWRSAEVGTTTHLTVAPDGTVYADAGDGNLHAFSPQLVHRRTYPVPGGVGAPPAIGRDGAVYVTSREPSLYGISPTGLLRWQGRAPGVTAPAMRWDGTILGTVYAGSDNGAFAWRTDGYLKWRFPSQPTVGAYSTPAFGWDNTVYVGAADGAVTALDAVYFTPWWRYQTGAPISVPPVVGGDGTVYVGSRGGGVSALTAGGALRWSYAAGGATVGLAIGPDGTVHVVADRLYAFGPGPGLVRSGGEE